MIDVTWVERAVANHQPQPDAAEAAARFEALLRSWAAGFAGQRQDVETGVLARPRRGVLADEAASFLRAVDAGIARVDEAGFVTLPLFKPKRPAGRYALFSKSGSGLALNLEYVIQVGAVAELVLDHGWPAEAIDFERGEFDALGSDSDGMVLLAVEAKARVAGADSLDHLLRSWLAASSDPTVSLQNNAGRKLLELRRLCQEHPVHVWLVADSARWSFTAQMTDSGLTLDPAGAPQWDRVTALPDREVQMQPSFPYDARRHAPGTVAASGRCSQHGVASCSEPPVVSFQDRHNRWQSGCQRAVDELSKRGEIAPLPSENPA